VSSHPTHQTRLLPSRHSVPALPWSLVSRSRLESLLDDQHRRHITLVSGLPGAGKTTLVATWLRSTDRPAAWVGLDARDNEPGRLARAIVGALARISAVPEPPARRRRPGSALLDQAFASLGPRPLGARPRRRARAALGRRPGHAAPRARPRARVPARRAVRPGRPAGRPWPAAARRPAGRDPQRRPRVHGGRGLCALRRLRHRAALRRGSGPVGTHPGLGGRAAAGRRRARRRRRPPRARPHHHRHRGRGGRLPAGGGARPPGGTDPGVPAAHQRGRAPDPGAGGAAGRRRRRPGPPRRPRAQRRLPHRRLRRRLVPLPRLFADLLRAGLRSRNPGAGARAAPRAPPVAVAHGATTEAESHARMAGDWPLVGRLVCDRWLGARPGRRREWRPTRWPGTPPAAVVRRGRPVPGGSGALVHPRRPGRGRPPTAPGSTSCWARLRRATGDQPPHGAIAGVVDLAPRLGLRRRRPRPGTAAKALASSGEPSPEVNGHAPHVRRLARLRARELPPRRRALRCGGRDPGGRSRMSATTSG
jgi:hypothetical protein